MVYINDVHQMSCIIFISCLHTHTHTHTKGYTYIRKRTSTRAGTGPGNRNRHTIRKRLSDAWRRTVGQGERESEGEAHRSAGSPLAQTLTPTHKSGPRLKRLRSTSRLSIREPTRTQALVTPTLLRQRLLLLCPAPGPLKYTLHPLDYTIGLCPRTQ